ncbi:MAG TPA: formate dehydrogenase accessory sulfurtransferase FdhD, partial [Planctomycetota bacterium]|nr:formate dehydrogenase accessory sulfurtransferase FdhD [Planctomycetota bacterium]
LALGYLFVEGWIEQLEDVASVEVGEDETGTDGAKVSTRSEPDPRCKNIADVTPRPGYRPPLDAGQRDTRSTAACGICGKRTIAEAMMLRPPPLTDPSVELPWAPSVLARLPDLLRERQELFHLTGALHAAGLFSSTGELFSLREDIGRHNAVDKVIGDAFRRGCLPLSAYALQVSGRVSFEIVQKAHRAGIPLISAVSGVSSLAVEFAERAGITLIGFVRDGRSTVYTHPQRLSLRGSSSARSVATRDRS